MTPTHKTLVVAGFLLCGLTMPQASYAISGCTNARLTGTYNAQVSSASLMNVLNTLNPTTTSTTTSTLQGGFGNNTNSLSGAVPGLGRYFLDGNGNIDGVASGGVGYATIGSYTVNDDCTATMTLNSGQTFNALVVAGGARVLFIESDASGAGAVGELDIAANACLFNGAPQTFAFNSFGAQQVTTSSGGTGGTTTTTAATFQPTSALGSITFYGNGSFSMKEWLFSSGSLQPLNATGTYTFGMNCSLQLTFNAATSATTGSAATTPSPFQGQLVSSSSGFVVIPNGQNFISATLTAQ